MEPLGPNLLEPVVIVTAPLDPEAAEPEETTTEPDEEAAD
jgi:hypothetical protein